MEINEFIIHKTRWLNGFQEHMKLSNVDFKTYMCMNGLSKEEFDVLDAKSNKKSLQKFVESGGFVRIFTR